VELILGGSYGLWAISLRLTAASFSTLIQQWCSQAAFWEMEEERCWLKSCEIKSIYNYSKKPGKVKILLSKKAL
jgi:hypothetical protein